MADLLAVTRRMPDLEERAGAGNTETEALESTRKFLLERESLRNRRENEVPAGRKNGLLVFRPGAGLQALLGIVFVSFDEPACVGDGR